MFKFLNLTAIIHMKIANAHHREGYPNSTGTEPGAGTGPGADSKPHSISIRRRDQGLSKCKPQPQRQRQRQLNQQQVPEYCISLQLSFRLSVCQIGRASCRERVSSPV